MAFVFSPWYFVLIIFVAAIIASVVAFIRMDKKDRVLIDEFVKQSQEQVGLESENLTEEKAADETVDVKKE